MRIFGQTFTDKVGEDDGKLDQFDDFCVKYVGAIDQLFSSLPNTIRSPTTKRT